MKRGGGAATRDKFCNSRASCVTFEASNIASFAYIKYLAMHISAAFAAHSFLWDSRGLYRGRSVNQKYNRYITALVHALVRFLIFSLLLSYGVLNGDAVLFRHSKFCGTAATS